MEDTQETEVKKAPNIKRANPVLKEGGAIYERMMATFLDVHTNAPKDIDFLHSVLCQVGVPRSSLTVPVYDEHGHKIGKQDVREWQRKSGDVSVMLKAGELYDGEKFVPMPMPYGPIPRLILIYVIGEAVRKRTRIVDVGNSLRSFIHRLGLSDNGAMYRKFRRQAGALAACTMVLGMRSNGTVVTVKTAPIERFSIWGAGSRKNAEWDGQIVLSEQFYETLIEHAVPLDTRALSALQDSALALDIYCWLAYRLYQIQAPEGKFIPWRTLKVQFGDEYNDTKNFKKRFLKAFRRALGVYKDAKVSIIKGGICIYPSPPPISRSQMKLF